MLAPLGASARRMFGGLGLFAGGRMFGLVSDDVTYFKTDAAGQADYRREGCVPFRYDTRKGQITIGSYWRVPERLFDDEAELQAWARRAIAVASALPAKRGHAARQGATAKPARKRTDIGRKRKRR
ncbi:MAG: TfoX/Sxy family protein [Alphaproteobacteria bacterium]|nr:TfoX/Sxy family protein [Alphaproteobacteria bacterium]